MVRKFINKIIIKIDKDKVKQWISKKKQRIFKFKKSDFYICRVCKHVLPENQMSSDDNSICKDCSKS